MAAPTVIPEDPDDEWNLSLWQEQVEDRRPGNAVFSYSQSAVTETIVVPANQVRSCVRQLLGYSLANHTTYLLERKEVPVRHPWWRHLWADSVQVQEIVPLAQPQADGTTKAKKDADDPDLYAPAATGRYGHSLVTVQFRHLPWLVWRDDDDLWATYLGEEWRRFTACTSVRPILDIQTVDADAKSQFVFAERDQADVANSPRVGPGGKPIPNGQIPYRKQQVGFSLLWRGVEETYLTGPYPDDVYAGFLLPDYERLNRYMGCVNAVTFLGHKPGTLLFDYEVVGRYPFPGVRTNYDFGLIGVDILMKFTLYRPPQPAAVIDSNGNVVADGDRWYGHLALPFAPNPNHYHFVATAGTDATRGTLPGSSRLALEPLDFYDLFYHHDDPIHPIPD